MDSCGLIFDLFLCCTVPGFRRGDVEAGTRFGAGNRRAWPSGDTKKGGKIESKIKGAARRARKALSAHGKRRHAVPNSRAAKSREAAAVLAYSRAAYA